MNLHDTFEAEKYHALQSNYYYIIVISVKSNLFIFSLEKSFILKEINKRFTPKEIHPILWINPLN